MTETSGLYNERITKNIWDRWLLRNSSWFVYCLTTRDNHKINYNHLFPCIYCHLNQSLNILDRKSGSRCGCVPVAERSPRCTSNRLTAPSPSLQISPVSPNSQITTNHTATTRKERRHRFDCRLQTSSASCHKCVFVPVWTHLRSSVMIFIGRCMTVCVCVCVCTHASQWQ